MVTLDSSFVFSEIEKKVSNHFFGTAILSKFDEDTWKIIRSGKIMENYRVKKNGDKYKFERVR